MEALSTEIWLIASCILVKNVVELSDAGTFNQSVETNLVFAGTNIVAGDGKTSTSGGIEALIIDFIKSYGSSRQGLGAPNNLFKVCLIDLYDIFYC